jgi:hypothetical protein
MPLIYRRGGAYSGFVLLRRLYVGWQRPSAWASARFTWTRLARVNNHLWIGPLYLVWGRFAKQ